MAYKPKYPPGTWNPRAPRPQSCGPRPQAWKSGPDPEEHKKYRVFIQQKNQAQWREEPWQITFEEWKQLWDESGQWHNRGRERSCYCMTRRDVMEPWTKHNAVVISREEHSRKQSALTHAGYRSIAQIKRRARLGLPEQKRKTGRKPQQ
jgi:hypothetical protein